MLMPMWHVGVTMCGLCIVVSAGCVIDVGMSAYRIPTVHGKVAERSKAPGSGTPELANLVDFLVSVMGREFESHPCQRTFAVLLQVDLTNFWSTF